MQSFVAFACYLEFFMYFSFLFFSKKKLKDEYYDNIFYSMIAIEKFLEGTWNVFISVELFYAI